MKLRQAFTAIGMLLVSLAVGLVLLFIAAQVTRLPLPTATPQLQPPPSPTPGATLPPTAGPPHLERCPPSQISAALEQLPAYAPTSGNFVTLGSPHFAVDSMRLIVRGVNYYPARTPWRRFLTETTPEAILHELHRIHRAGFNTLRIFLWYEPLFQCAGSGAVPRPDTFRRLDEFIRLAANTGFHLIVTLNDIPDLAHMPLYTAPLHTQEQTRYIVQRYRDEPGILAWDLRNEGDIDYREAFPREQVLAWLKATSALVRQTDPNHLITAGWLNDAAATAPYVDFLSFHHWRGADELVERIKALRTRSDKPLLLEEVGYSVLGRSEAKQADLLEQAIAAAESQNLAGWLVWTAFDFPREATCWPGTCLSPDNQEHYFGLWRTDYSPKPALERIRQYMSAP